MTMPSDGAASDDDVVMTTSPTLPNPPSSNPSDSPKDVSLHTYSVKFEFKTTSTTFPAPEIHRKLLLDVERHFPSTTINTNTNAQATITVSKHNEAFFLRNFKYPSFSRTKFSLVCVAHSISTPASFNEIKSSMQKTLSQNKAFIRVNQWSTEDLNIANIGWIYEAHPQAHNRNTILSTIKKFCTTNNKSEPSIEIFSKSISAVNSAKRVSTQAIQFACRRQDSESVKSTLQQCFSDSSIYLPGKFIPSDLGNKQGQDVLVKYIHLQNKYLADHRSISIIGIQPHELATDFSPCNDHPNIIQSIHQCKLIDWITPTNRTNSTGRFLLSTDKHRYKDALVWVDNTFLPLFTLLPKRNLPSQFTHPFPIRTGLKHNDVYTSSLASSISNVSDVTYPKPPNAWTKPISIIASRTPQTSISRITKSTTDSDLIACMEKQIANLQQKLEANQTIHAQTVANAVEKAITSHQKKLDDQYHTMLQSLQDHWKQVTSTIPDIVQQQIMPSTTSNPPLPNPSVQALSTPPRHDDKRARESPCSGSDRYRKPRRCMNDSLDSAQRPITSFLSQPKPPDPNHPKEMSYENYMPHD